MRKVSGQFLKGALYTVAFVGFALPAFAQLTPTQQQAVDRQVGTASPGRMDERMLEEEFVPRVTPDVEVRKLELQGAPAGAEDIKFELGGIVMDGATVYPQEALRAVYADRLGTTISLADLYVIAAEITRKYRNDGYILTQVVVPPQTIEGGIATLRVVEGRINNIEVRGTDDGSLQLIRDYAERIKIGGVMNSKDLERALLLINDLPGIDARGILNPSPDTVGAADLVILIERKSYDGQIGIDNMGTRYLGPIQLSAAMSLNSWFNNNERLTGQFVVAPHGDGRFAELMYGALTYEQAFGPYGDVATFFFSHTHTEPGYTLEQFNVKGWSTALSAQIMHPFVRTRSFNVSGRVKFDYREVTSQNDIPVDPTRDDHIRTLRVGGTVEALDNWFGVAYNVADFEVSRGLHLFGANKQGDIDMSRPAADPTFIKFNAELQRLQRLDDKLNLLLGVTGQWSSDALLSSEEFGVGGFSYGRGYDPSEVIGDDGIAGKIEVQWEEPYKLSLLDDYQLYGFYDVGRIWNEDATTSADKRETLTSTGFGIRADLGPTTEGGFLLAFPLNNTPQTSDDRDPRIYLNVNHRF